MEFSEGTLIMRKAPLMVRTTVTTTANEQSPVFDLQGRSVKGGNLPKGIYISNGKKILR